VFVFHFENDVANDYAHPHSTVIGGMMVDIVEVDDQYKLVRRSVEDVANRMAAEVARRTEAEPGREGAGMTGLLKRFSLSAHLVNATKNAIVGGISRGEGPAPGATPALAHFYSVPYESNGRYWYAENPFAAPNRRAILDFKEWTDERSIPLVVVLVPRNRGRFDPEWYQDLQTFLNLNDIRFLDLASAFARLGLEPRDVYWPNDPHFNRLGNEAVARVLLAEFPELFRR
jgi:hypothetical protein